ncbi:MAG: ABC transporter permease subunit [Streptosporangiales bacterium]|nr:ABC transporter permease subunit [Streptosporangiales bacterium]
MTFYLIRRVGQAFVVVVIVSIVTFILSRLLPGEPARAILGLQASPVQIEAFRQARGYDEPLIVQYGMYVDRLLHGDFGFSYKENETVAALVAQRLPPTVLLVGLSVVVAVILAVPLGMLQATRRNRPIDYGLTGASFVFYSMPSFWLGLLLITLFAVYLDVLPAGAPQGSMSSVLAEPAGLVLPVMTLALVTLAEFSRYMRSSTLDNLGEGYVSTARAKGASERRVLYHHVLRNALVPIVTLLGLRLPAILNGALITEGVFNYPGIGRLFWQATQSQDYDVLLGVTLIVAVGTVAGSLIADVSYAVLDPRVRYVQPR